MKLEFKGNCMAVRYFGNVPSIPFQIKLCNGGHSTETGITPRQTLNSGYLKEDLRVVIKVLTGSWLGTKKLLSIRKKIR